MKDEKVGELAAETVSELRDMTDEIRVEFFTLLFDTYCRHCGIEQENACQCWNDE